MASVAPVGSASYKVVKRGCDQRRVNATNQTSYVNNTHLKMCTFSLIGLLFVFSLLHPELVYIL